MGKVLIDTYLHDNPFLSMQSKILMLNEIIYSKYENEVLGKEVKFPAKERRELDKKYKTYFGKDDWKGSVYDFYSDFLHSQKEKEYDIDIPNDSLMCMIWQRLRIFISASRRQIRFVRRVMWLLMRHRILA